MQYKTEVLPLGTLRYPVINRLPKGTRIVRQDGYSRKKAWCNYYAFDKNGAIVCSSHATNLRDAKKDVIAYLNKQSKYYKSKLVKTK